MTRRDNLHSRLVAWLKVALPLAALAILSTLFLFARSTDLTQDLPFAEVDLRERARSQQVTRPSFAGATESGDLIAVVAESARPEVVGENRLLAENVTARIDLVGGRAISFRADRGVIDMPQDVVHLTGSVVFTATGGWQVTAETLTSGLREIRAVSEQGIAGRGPPGEFTAGRMELTTDTESGDAHLVFTDRVKLIYEPRSTE